MTLHNLSESQLVECHLADT